MKWTFLIKPFFLHQKIKTKTKITFFIIFKVLPLKQIKQFFLEGDSPTLIVHNLLINYLKKKSQFRNSCSPLFCSGSPLLCIFKNQKQPLADEKFRNILRNTSMLESLQACNFFFFKLGFTPCKAEQPLQDMELQEKEAQKD